MESINNWEISWWNTNWIVINTIFLELVKRCESVWWLSSFLDEFIWHYLFCINCIEWSISCYFPFKAVFLWMILYSVEWIFSSLPQSNESLIIWRYTFSYDFPERWQVFVIIICIHRYDPMMIINHNTLASCQFGNNSLR